MTSGFEKSMIAEVREETLRQLYESMKFAMKRGNLTHKLIKKMMGKEGSSCPIILK